MELNCGEIPHEEVFRLWILHTGDQAIRYMGNVLYAVQAEVGNQAHTSDSLISLTDRNCSG